MTLPKALTVFLLATLLSGCIGTLKGTAKAAPGKVQNPLIKTLSWKETISVNGALRHYRLYVPASYRPGVPVALVINLHGLGTNPIFEDLLSGMSLQAEREGFIVVYPEAQNAAWDAAVGNKTKEDLDFINDLAQSLQSRYSIDPKRIYATGISNGGGMANRIACNLANLVAAIGPVSGAYNLWQDCHPSRPVPVIAFHGTADKIVPYEGFQIEAVAPPIPKWAAAWAQRNGCNPEPRESNPKPDVHIKTWENCRENAAVVLYTIDHQGHSWPGSSLLPEITSQAVNANDLMWEFFQAHPMP